MDIMKSYMFITNGSLKLRDNPQNASLLEGISRG